MGNGIALSGNDTLILDNRVFTDLADGDCVMVDFPNDISTVKIGKNDNAIYGLNQMGQLAEMTIRTLRGSADDKYLNNRLIQQNANFEGMVLVQGQFIKKIGDGTGTDNITSDTYIAGGGIFKKNVSGKSNVEGDAAQSVAEYKLTFSKCIRVLT